MTPNEIQLGTAQMILNQELEKLGMRKGFSSTIKFMKHHEDWCLEFSFDFYKDTIFRCFVRSKNDYTLYEIETSHKLITDQSGLLHFILWMKEKELKLSSVLKN